MFLYVKLKSIINNKLEYLGSQNAIPKTIFKTIYVTNWIFLKTENISTCSFTTRSAKKAWC